MKQALGLVEIQGLSTAVLVADTMVKAANIRILEIENTRGLGYMTIKIAGDVGAVTAAVTAGRQVGAMYQKLVSWKVIPRPSDYVERTFCSPTPPGNGAPSGKEQIIPEKKGAAVPKGNRPKVQGGMTKPEKAETPSGAGITARVKAEAPAPVKAEAPAQVKAETPAQVKAEAPAQVQAEAQVKAEAPAPVKAEAPAQAEAQVKAEAPAQVKAEVPAQAEAPAQVKAEAPAQVKAEIPAQAETPSQTEIPSKPDATEAGQPVSPEKKAPSSSKGGAEPKKGAGTKRKK